MDFKPGFDFLPHFTAKPTERTPHPEGFTLGIYESGDGRTAAPLDPGAPLIAALHNAASRAHWDQNERSGVR